MVLVTIIIGGTVLITTVGVMVMVGTTGAIMTRIGILLIMEATIIAGLFTTLGAMDIMEILTEIMGIMVIITTDITAIMDIIADVTFPTVPAEEAVITVVTPEV